MWLSPLLQKEAGVSLKSRELYDAGETTAKIVPQLLSSNPRFDWFCMPSLYFGLFAEVGLLEPLDQYLDTFGGSKEYFDWIMPGYGEFYSQWGGQTYGLMVDGDIHNLHYRPSYFADKANQDEFSKRFQRELTVPVTWDEYRDTARFFTDKYKSQDIYGTSVRHEPAEFLVGFLDGCRGQLRRDLFRPQHEPTNQPGPCCGIAGDVQGDRGNRPAREDLHVDRRDDRAVGVWRGRHVGLVDRSCRVHRAQPRPRAGVGSGDRAGARHQAGRRQHEAQRRSRFTAGHSVCPPTPRKR